MKTCHTCCLYVIRGRGLSLFCVLYIVLNEFAHHEDDPSQQVAVILLKYEKSGYKTYIYVVVWRVLLVISDYLPRLPSKVLKIGLEPNWIGHDFRGQLI